jgi:hypothetical protein
VLLYLWSRRRLADRQSAAAQQQLEQAREARIKVGNKQINSTFAPFNDALYASRSKAYTDWGQPQLESQFADQALAEATKARTAVNNTKMDLQNQLTATGDSSVAASNALAAGKVNQNASAYTPLGNMFGNVMGGVNDAASYRGIISSPAYGVTGLLPPGA